MHSRRRPRERGGRSAKRKKLRGFFWNAVDPSAEVDNSVLSGLAEPEEEVVEVVNEPVEKQQAKAKALRLRSNPRPSSSSSSAVVGAIENPSSSSGSRIVGSEASSSSNPGCGYIFRSELFFRSGTTISGCGTCNRSRSGGRARRRVCVGE